MPLSASKLKVGDTHTERVVENLTRTQLVQYAGASGDYNPLHTDEVYSVHAGYKGVFAHGMLTMGLTGKMLTNYVGDARLKKFGVARLSHFAGPIQEGKQLCRGFPRPLHRAAVAQPIRERPVEANQGRRQRDGPRHAEIAV